MSKKRHRWSGKVIGSSHDYKGGIGAQCIKCGCVKERIRGVITYFIDDTTDDRAPECDERLLEASWCSEFMEQLKDQLIANKIDAIDSETQKAPSVKVSDTELAKACLALELAAASRSPKHIIIVDDVYPPEQLNRNCRKGGYDWTDTGRKMLETGHKAAEAIRELGIKLKSLETNDVDPPMHSVPRDLRHVVKKMSRNSVGDMRKLSPKQNKKRKAKRRAQKKSRR